MVGCGALIQTATNRACLDQHLITIRSREVLGDHVWSKTWEIAITLRWSAAVQTRPTIDTVVCYAAARVLMSSVDANNCCWPYTTYAGWKGWGGSRELLQLQQQVGGRCMVRCGEMGALGVDAGGYYADNWRQPVVNDPITLHGDHARCVYGPFFL